MSKYRYCKNSGGGDVSESNFNSPIKVEINKQNVLTDLKSKDKV
jgi:hypothetical protein